MGLVSRYIAHTSLRHDEACYSDRQMLCLERHGELAQWSSYLRLEGPQGFEMSVRDGGLSACVWRHALSKQWC